VVLGISATVERFNKAMEGAKGRITLPSVEVDRCGCRFRLTEGHHRFGYSDEVGRLILCWCVRAAIS